MHSKRSVGKKKASVSPNKVTGCCITLAEYTISDQEKTMSEKIKLGRTRGGLERRRSDLCPRTWPCDRLTRYCNLEMRETLAECLAAASPCRSGRSTCSLSGLSYVIKKSSRSVPSGYSTLNCKNRKLAICKNRIGEADKDHTLLLDVVHEFDRFRPTTAGFIIVFPPISSPIIAMKLFKPCLSATVVC